ncbi:MAG: 4Fe-4S dicluster-binding protein [Asgard group archaeon]|nr:4Fe-4S dicluster-binding protein [Asgard group archaeon]
MTKNNLLSEKEMKEWIDKKWGYENLPMGGTVPFAGSSVYFKTGDWSPNKAVVDKDECIKCQLCFFLCPDSAITMDDDKYPVVDFDYCKGCGICVAECPVQCIDLKDMSE